MSRAGALFLAAVATSGCLTLVDAGFDEAKLVGDGKTTTSSDGKTTTSSGDCEPDDVEVWSTPIEGSGIQWVWDMAVSGDGSAVLTGFSSGGIAVAGDFVEGGIFVIKVDPAGEPVWGKGFGPFGSMGIAIAFDPNGDVVVVAHIAGPTSFGGIFLDPPSELDRYTIAKLSGRHGEHIWSRFVGSGAEPLSNLALAVDGDGSLLVTGTCWEGLDWTEGMPLDGSGLQMFLSRLDPDGKHLFTTGHGPNAFPHRIALDSNGNPVILGVTNGNQAPPDFGGGLIAIGETTSFIVALTPEGDHLWSHALGSGTEPTTGRGLAALADGKIAVAVPFYGALEAGETTLMAEGLDTGVVMFDAKGDPIWARRLHSSGADVPWNMAATPDGGVVIGGAFEGEMDTGDLCPVEPSGPVVPKFAEIMTDAFLAELDSAGEPRRIVAFGDADDNYTSWAGEIVSNVGVAEDGSIIVSASFDGTVDWGHGPVIASGEGDVLVGRYKP